MDYIAPVRRQVDNIFAAARTENGQLLVPHYYGESGGKVGWYGYREGEFFPTGALGNLSETTIELYLWSLNPPISSEFCQTRRTGVRYRAGSSSCRERGRITRSKRCSRSSRMPAKGRTHQQEGQRIWCEPRRVRVARQPHARRGESVRLGRRAAKPGAVFRPRASPRGPHRRRCRARRKNRARQRDADARQHERHRAAPADRADGRVR